MDSEGTETLERYKSLAVHVDALERRIFRLTEEATLMEEGLKLLLAEVQRKGLEPQISPMILQMIKKVMKKYHVETN